MSDKEIRQEITVTLTGAEHLRLLVLLMEYREREFRARAEMDGVDPDELYSKIMKAWLTGVRK